MISTSFRDIFNSFSSAHDSKNQEKGTEPNFGDPDLRLTIYDHNADQPPWYNDTDLWKNYNKSIHCKITNKMCHNKIMDVQNIISPHSEILLILRVTASFHHESCKQHTATCSVNLHLWSHGKLHRHNMSLVKVLTNEWCSCLNYCICSDSRKTSD